MHTAPSLGKRPIKVQHYYKNLKVFFFFFFFFGFFGGWGGGGVSLFIFFLAGFTRSYEKSSIKIHSIENIFVRGPSDNLSGGVCMCALFSPEIVKSLSSRLQYAFPMRNAHSYKHWYNNGFVMDVYGFRSTGYCQNLGQTCVRYFT